jgi:hypothetical protein
LIIDPETVGHAPAVRAEGKEVGSLSCCSDSESEVFYEVDSGLSNREAQIRVVSDSRD